MLLIGSRAFISFYGASPLGRTPKDFDYIVTKDYFDNLVDAYKIQPKFNYPNIAFCILNNKPHEFEIATPGSSAEDYLRYAEENKLNGIADIHILYSLKKSHIHCPIHFEKNIQDYHICKQICDDRDVLEEITKKRIKETNERLKLRTPSLMKSKDDFFNDKTIDIRVFEHDDIHNAVKHLDKPIYSYMQNDANVVLCDKNKWNEFPMQWKLWAVEEESTVIALERKILPSLFKGKKYVSAEDALKWALMRVCTTLCSGWFRQFAIDNYFNVLNSYNKEYVKDFLDKFENGEIKAI